MERKRFIKIFVFFCLFYFFLYEIICFCDQISLQPLDNRWALVIGISSYKDSQINLKYAADDANAFSESLIKLGRVDKSHIKSLIDKSATYENIRRIIEGWLSLNTGKDDFIIIYFSGHGTYDIDDDGDEDDGLDEFLVPYDYDSNDISTAIRDDDFAFWINKLKSNKILLIIDSCFSGGVAKGKGLVNNKIKGQKSSDNVGDDLLKDFPKKGVALLSACKSDQVSYEAPEFKHGLFTYFLLLSFDGSSDIDRDRIITMEESFDSLKAKTCDYSRNKYSKTQEPELKNNIKDIFNLIYLPIPPSISLNDKEKAESLLKEASSARDIKRKLLLLEEASTLDPSNYLVSSGLAYQYKLIKEYDKSLNMYDRAIATTDFDGFRRLFNSNASDVLVDKGDFKLAIERIKKAISIVPDVSDYNKLGKLYFIIRDTMNSKQSFMKGLEISPTNNDSLLGAARVLISEEKYNDAIKCLDEAITDNPDYWENHYIKALVAEYVMKDKDLALSELKIIEDEKYIFERDFEFLLKSQDDSDKYEIELEKEIGQLDILSNKYISLWKHYLGKKVTSKADECYKKLIYIYPFFKEKEEFRAYYKLQ
jgi:tetratricopeptide (TPR) repeat protein